MKTPKRFNIDLTPMRRYLAGFAAGTESATGHRTEIEVRHPDGIYHSKVFTTRKAALDAATAQFPGKQVYVRPYTYETANPANAAGMPLLEESGEKTTWHPVSV